MHTQCVNPESHSSERDYTKWWQPPQLSVPPEQLEAIEELRAALARLGQGPHQSLPPFVSPVRTPRVCYRHSLFQRPRLTCIPRGHVQDPQCFRRVTRYRGSVRLRRRRPHISLPPVRKPSVLRQRKEAGTHMRISLWYFYFFILLV